MTQQEIIEGVKKHAQDNYGKGGWDVIVECYDDREIKEVLDGNKTWDLPPITTLKKAISEFKKIADLQDERRREQINEIF